MKNDEISQSETRTTEQPLKMSSSLYLIKIIKDKNGDIFHKSIQKHLTKSSTPW